MSKWAVHKKWRCDFYVKRFLSIVFFLLVSIVGTSYATPDMPPPLATLEAEKDNANTAIIIRIVPKETYKWSKEFKTSLDIHLAYKVSGVKCYDEQCVENHAYKIKQNQIVEDSGYRHYEATFEIVEGVPTVVFTLLSPSQHHYIETAHIKIKFAVCNETSCYPQKAEKIVRF